VNVEMKIEMNNDLISKNEVLKIIEGIKCDDSIPKNYGTLLDIMRQIRNIPIAYNVDRVMEQLKDSAIKELGITKAEFEMDKGEYSSYNTLSLCDVREIVENGGVTEGEDISITNV